MLSIENLYFRSTVIEAPEIWFKDDGNLSRVICEDGKYFTKSKKRPTSTSRFGEKSSSTFDRWSYVRF